MSKENDQRMKQHHNYLTSNVCCSSKSVHMTKITS